MTSDGGILRHGDRLPVLVLKRDGRDAARLRRHLRGSERVEAAVVGPDALLRAPLRWPSDPRVQPLALLASLSERPGALASAGHLVRRLGDLPLVVVSDGSRSFSLDLLEVGAEEVLEIRHLSGSALERALVTAVTRRIGGVVHVDDAAAPVDLARLAPEDATDRSLSLPG